MARRKRERSEEYLLLNENRRKILEFVKYPFSTYGRIRAEIGLSPQSLQDQLKVLSRFLNRKESPSFQALKRGVKEKDAYRFPHFGLVGDEIAKRNWKRYAMLNYETERGSSTLRVVAALVGEERISLGELAKKLALNPPTVHYYMNRLRWGELIDEKRKGRCVYCRIKQKGGKSVLEKMLEEYKNKKKREAFENWVVNHLGVRKIGVIGMNYSIFSTHITRIYHRKKREEVDVELTLCMNPMAELLKEIEEIRKREGWN